MWPPLRVVTDGAVARRAKDGRWRRNPGRAAAWLPAGCRRRSHMAATSCRGHPAAMGCCCRRRAEDGTDGGLTSATELDQFWSSSDLADQRRDRAGPPRLRIVLVSSLRVMNLDDREVACPFSHCGQGARVVRCPPGGYQSCGRRLQSSTARFQDRSGATPPRSPFVVKCR